MTYPFVHCDKHGKCRSLAVCVHVRAGLADVAHYLEATDKEMGEVLCKPCHEHFTRPHLICSVICEKHVEEMLATRRAVN